ncbi:MAG: response regulator transcription factor [Spirochaetaceae bacterium]
MKKVLMIEDDKGISRVVGDRLKAEGYDFYPVYTGNAGMEKVLTEEFDILLVDLMLPGVSGFDVIREIRSRGNHTPIIITSAKFQMSDKVSGLRLGADDYIVKPFEFDELLARIEAQIRRKSYNELQTDIVEEKNISFDDFVIDFKNCNLQKNGTQIPLSKIEYKLLSYLTLNPDRVISMDELIEKVWGYETVVSTRTVYVHIAWLRKKLKSDRVINRIRTVRGIGYQFIL